MKNLLLILLFSTFNIFAEPIEIPYSQDKVKIDGVLDDAIWDNALIVDLLYEVDPGNSIPADVSTKAYIIDIGHSILIGFKAQDPNPKSIRAFLRDRDSAWRDDFVGVILDTYNDEIRALEFFVNPLGIQMDLIRDDSGGGSNEDSSWDAIWDSSGKITGDGYTVEMLIPYNEIQMAHFDGKKTWGINFFRSYPRNVRKQIQDTPYDRNNNCSLCQYNKYSGFSNAERGLDLEITPSITMISNQTKADIKGDYSEKNTDIEPSLDINWGINSNLTLNATLNPDFSQIESDSAQLDINRTFALFFPEKRPFFLENSDFFNTRMNLIHTRNVADPDYGLRLVGKSGKNAYGFFYTDDTITNILIPGVFGSGLASLEQESDNLVARYRRDFGNASTAGGLITRRKSNNYSNTVTSFDTTYKITDENAIIFQYSSSDTRNPQQIMEEFEQEKDLSGNAYYFQYRHADENLFYNVTHQSFDTGYRADLGFIGQVGNQKTIVGAQYTWRPQNQDKWWNRISVYSDWDITHDQHGRLIEKELEASLNINAGKQSHFNLYTNTRDRLWDDILFDENIIGLNFNIKPISGIEFGTGYNVGDSIDFSNSKIAKKTGANIYANLNIGQHLSINLDHSFQKLNRDGGNVFIANQTDLRFSYQFNIKQRLRLSIINTNVNRDLSLYDSESEIDSHFRRLSNQLIYSYKVNPKTLLFLGYSDSGYADQHIDLTTENRTLFAKFSYAWKR